MKLGKKERTLKGRRWYVAMDYKQAGVDIEAGDALVEWIKAQNSKQPHSDRLVSGVGGFSALFDIKFPQMKNPCLVSCTDGVGTKLQLASRYNSYKSVAQDLVAMCVNDLICCGAEPLFFLDYFACGKLDVEMAKEFVAGVQAACTESGCALIGGETAEMPGTYQEKDFDCAGFSVGVVDREKAFGAEHVQLGDKIVAIRSSGCHSNGYSLLRKIFEEDMDEWADQLLTPTRLYPALMKTLKSSGVQIHSVSHITGGGLNNIPRVLPNNMAAHLRPWLLPEVFQEVFRRGQMGWKSLLETLNCGVGLALIVPSSEVDKIEQLASEASYQSFLWGEVVADSPDFEGIQWSVDLDKQHQLNFGGENG